MTLPHEGGLGIRACPQSGHGTQPRVRQGADGCKEPTWARDGVGISPDLGLGAPWWHGHT